MSADVIDLAQYLRGWQTGHLVPHQAAGKPDRPAPQGPVPACPGLASFRLGARAARRERFPQDLALPQNRYMRQVARMAAQPPPPSPQLALPDSDFAAALERASAVVEGWPAWKRAILGGPA